MSALELFLLSVPVVMIGQALFFAWMFKQLLAAARASNDHAVRAIRLVARLHGIDLDSALPSNNSQTIEGTADNA